MFKNLFISILIVFISFVVQAQNSPTQPSFITALTAQILSVAVEHGVAAERLPMSVVLVCDRDAEGAVRWTQPGADSLTRAVVTAALEQLGEVSAYDGAADAGVRYTIRIPVEQLTAAREVEPLLFRGEEASVAFPAWANDELRTRGVKGVAEVRFYIEPDGWVALGSVATSSSPKFTREVQRVVRASRDKWTVRKVRGVPQRTAFDYRAQMK